MFRGVERVVDLAYSDPRPGISEGLAREVVVARVNGELWDASRPLEQDCHLELLKVAVMPLMVVIDLPYLLVGSPPHLCHRPVRFPRGRRGVLALRFAPPGSCD
jgi:hypothetical protein